MTSVLVVAPLAVVLADDTLRKWFGASLAIPLVLGLLNSLTEGASPRKSMAPTKLRLRECTFSVVVTE